MQIKFLQASTARACLALASVGSMGLVAETSTAMNADEHVRRAAAGLAPINSNWSSDQRRDYEQLKIIEQRKQAARNEKESRAQKEKEEKERERRERWEKEGKAQQEEKRKILQMMEDGRRKAEEKEAKEHQEKVQSGPSWMQKYEEEVGRLSAEDRVLWEEWDEERNWRMFYEIWRVGTTMEYYNKDRRRTEYTRTYLSNLYYPENGGGILACEKDHIAEAGLADHRWGDILYFVEHKGEMPDKLIEYKEFRLQQNADYIRDKSRHRELFPKNKKQKNPRQKPENVRRKTDTLRRELDKDPFREEKRCIIS